MIEEVDCRLIISGDINQNIGVNKVGHLLRLRLVSRAVP